eukprot:1393864-Amorphochlora_amoeboformis.AAC.2
MDLGPSARKPLRTDCTTLRDPERAYKLSTGLEGTILKYSEEQRNRIIDVMAARASRACVLAAIVSRLFLLANVA